MQQPITMLYLRDDFKTAWQGQDPFQLLDAMPGETFRCLEARRTYRFEFKGRGFFAKVHKGVGWGEIIANLLRLRRPVLGARNEWQALNRLHQLGVDTMTPVAFGEKGWNPARQCSFLVTEELEAMISLEDVCAQWRTSPPPARLKWALVKKLAQISRVLHSHGINHRDFYLCHFLVAQDSLADSLRNPGQVPRLFLIDLHRAQIRRQLPERWRIKDLSGLYFSAMDCGFTRRDIFRFIRNYTGLPLRQSLTGYQTLLTRVNRKASKLYQRMQRKAGHSNY